MVTGGLSSTVAYWILSRPVVSRWLDAAGKWTKYQLDVGKSELTRYAALLLSTGVAIGAYCLAAVSGYAPWPSTGLEWVNLIFGLGAVAFSGSQMIHGARDLRARDRRIWGPVQVEIER
jgi:hypothetical protein